MQLLVFFRAPNMQLIHVNMVTRHIETCDAVR